jgi:RNA recognition motif-containing protein
MILKYSFGLKLLQGTKLISMGKKLYVGSLSYSTTEEGMRAAFERAGSVVSVQIIMDKMTNRSKGFGFVEMGTDEEAQAAIQMWDGQELDGRTLVVNEARPLEARPPRTGGYAGGGRGGGRGGFGGGNGGRQDRW